MRQRSLQIGQIVGNWMVLAYLGNSRWKVQCACKTIRIMCSTEVRRRISCGCKGINIKHGDARNGTVSPEYKTWAGMINRCYCPSSPQYRDYGGRGISVCGKWRNSFLDFLKDMGRRPSLDHSIDRIDNNGNYELGNCRWATAKEQNANTRSNRWITHNGLRMTLSEWARITGIGASTITLRLKHHWSVEEALTLKPLIGRNQFYKRFKILQLEPLQKKAS